MKRATTTRTSQKSANFYMNSNASESLGFSNTNVSQITPIQYSLEVSIFHSSLLPCRIYFAGDGSLISTLRAEPVNIILGTHVWVEDPNICWIDGQVTKINGQEVEVETTEGKKVTAKLSKIYPKDVDAPAGGVDDMTKLSYLHEPGVLQNLSTRLTHLYETHMMEQYKGAPLGELSPHVFAIADVAFRAMVNEGKSNSILVSGESGAGKTETTKMLMRYLAYLGGRKGTEGRTVEQQVLESNPVLEAFGNAKTVRNNNSRCSTSKENMLLLHSV
ncbi:hypothetical protein L1887_13140 [Cichorium endivia]|nr:hypothetical protein L1887_13140 [Cichorium endivia]